MEAIKEESKIPDSLQEENGVIPVVDQEVKNPYVKDDESIRESTAINDFNEDANLEEKRSLDSQEIGEKEEQIDSFVQ